MLSVQDTSWSRSPGTLAAAARPCVPYTPTAPGAFDPLIYVHRPVLGLDESDLSKQNVLLLRAFSYYAAAAERAKDEDWPDDAWRHWRYRRASLARLLAREGMMQQVAGTYAATLDKRTPPPPKFLARLAAWSQ